MKKLLIAATIVSTIVLFGCDDEKQKTIDSVVSHLEAREDMLPYKLEFKDLKFVSISKKEVNGWLCGEMKISQKTNIKPNESPKIFFSKVDEEIDNAINSGDYFKFIHMVNPEFEPSPDGLAIKMIYPYDNDGLHEWEVACND
ncbi:hypothetical protein AB7X11_18520 [Providencia alcalifaciens]